MYSEFVDEVRGIVRKVWACVGERERVREGWKMVKI